jgi:hypothetical protein
MAKLILAAVALAAVLSLPEESVAQTTLRTTTGGNKALMEDWVRKKQELRERVCEELRRKNLLPRDSVVTFEAKVSSDPRAPDKFKVRIESLTITEHSGKLPSKDTNPTGGPVFGPRIPGGAQSIKETSFPEGGGTVRGAVVVIGGKPQEQGTP